VAASAMIEMDPAPSRGWRLQTSRLTDAGIGSQRPKGKGASRGWIVAVGRLTKGRDRGQEANEPWRPFTYRSRHQSRSTTVARCRRIRVRRCCRVARQAANDDVCGGRQAAGCAIVASSTLSSGRLGGYPHATTTMPTKAKQSIFYKAKKAGAAAVTTMIVER